MNIKKRKELYWAGLQRYDAGDFTDQALARDLARMIREEDEGWAREMQQTLYDNRIGKQIESLR